MPQPSNMAKKIQKIYFRSSRAKERRTKGKQNNKINKVITTSYCQSVNSDQDFWASIRFGDLAGYTCLHTKTLVSDKAALRTVGMKIVIIHCFSWTICCWCHSMLFLESWKYGMVPDFTNSDLRKQRKIQDDVGDMPRNHDTSIWRFPQKGGTSEK